jgi:hypothetical protein
MSQMRTEGSIFQHSKMRVAVAVGILKDLVGCSYMFEPGTDFGSIALLLRRSVRVYPE